MVGVDGLPSGSVAVIAREMQLQHDGVDDGAGAKVLSRRRKAQLGAESCLAEAENGVVHAAEQAVGDVFGADGVEVGMAHQLKRVGVVHPDVVVVRNQAVADGLWRLLAGRHGQY